MTVVWRGPVLDRSPWAAGSRDFLAGLRAAGAEVALEPLLWQPGSVISRDEEAVLAELSRVPLDDAAAGVQHVPGRILDPYAPGRVRVARTSLPGGVPGEDWLTRLAQMDDVWVPSAMQRDALVGAGVDAARVHVVPEPVRAPEGPSEPLALTGLHGTVVLAILDWTVRAGWERTLDAWCRAFGPDDDVTLLVHAFSSEGVDAYGADAMASVAAHGHDPERMPDVVLLEEPLPVARMAALYAAADVVCSAASGIGRGRDVLEAMAHGLPVIAAPGATGAPVGGDEGWTLDVDAAGAPATASLVDALRDARRRAGELPRHGPGRPGARGP